jgi:hypothetical protein
MRERESGGVRAAERRAERPCPRGRPENFGKSLDFAPTPNFYNRKSLSYQGPLILPRKHFQIFPNFFFGRFGRFQ